jgi:hypothetical protein
MAPTILEPIPNATPPPAASPATTAITVSHLALCREISSLGNYQTLDSNKLRPNQPLLVYAELSGIQPESASDGRQTVHLAATVEFWPNAGRAAAFSKSLGEVADTFPPPRDRHFIGFRIRTPNLPPGDYQLRLVSSDLLAGQVAQAEIPVSIEPSPR